MDGYARIMSPGAAHVKEEPECAVTGQVADEEAAKITDEEAEYVKAEPLSDNEGGSEAAVLAGLYTDHVVKDELVLGPVCVQRPHAATVPSELNSLVRDCWVRLERCALPSGATAGREPATATASRPAREHGSAPPQIRADTLQHVTNTYVCDICGRSVQQKHTLIRHVKAHLQFGIQKSDMYGAGSGKIKKPRSCEICKMVFKNASSLKIHTRTHREKKSNVCKICGKQFEKLSYLNIHNRIHTGEKPYGCKICQKEFTQLYNLKAHIRIHTGEKPYSCEICKKRFSNKQHLKIHKRIHDEERPYSCEICKKQFKSSVVLKTHKRTHTDDKPFHCEICNRTFSQSNHLGQHRRTHTEAQPYSCEICSKRFKVRSTLNAHRRIHSGVEP